MKVHIRKSKLFVFECISSETNAKLFYRHFLHFIVLNQAEGSDHSNYFWDKSTCMFILYFTYLNSSQPIFCMASGCFYHQMSKKTTHFKIIQQC